MSTKTNLRNKPRLNYVLVGFMFLLVMNLQFAAAYSASDFKDDLMEMGKTMFLPLIMIVGAAFLVGKVMESDSFHWFPKLMMGIFLIIFMIATSTMFPDPIGSTFDKAWGFLKFWD